MRFSTATKVTMNFASLADVMLAGADDYLVKPLRLIQLNARMKAALRLGDM